MDEMEERRERRETPSHLIKPRTARNIVKRKVKNTGTHDMILCTEEQRMTV